MTSCMRRTGQGNCIGESVLLSLWIQSYSKLVDARMRSARALAHGAFEGTHNERWEVPPKHVRDNMRWRTYIIMRDCAEPLSNHT